MTRERRARRGSATAIAVLLLITPVAQAEGNGGDSDACETSAAYLASACRLDADEESRIGQVVCVNLSNSRERPACAAAALEARREALGACKAQRDARLEVCEAIGDGPYDPRIDPRNFVPGVDNPFAPFSPGSRWVYEKRTGDGVERIVIEVLEETREILGVECTTVHDRVYQDGVLVEDTLDWLAQDRSGNVWYFGEISQSFEDGRLASIDGSWVAGVAGAKPGFWVKRAPRVGETYRQEWAPGEAEDVVQVLSLAAKIKAPFTGRGPVLQTRDFTPLSPDALEYKFYVPGVGLVLELDPETGERLELVEYIPG